MPLPPINQYALLTYLESVGAQYIDTMIAPSARVGTLKIEADMAYTETPTGSSTQSYLFGCGYYNSTAGNRRNIFCGYRGGTSTSLFSYLNGGQLSNAVAFTGATKDTDRHLFTIDQVNSVYGFDSNTQAFTSTVNANLTASIKIFCAHQSGTSGNPVGYYSKARLYGFKIWDGSTILRDFIPCIRISDSEYGLWDQVSGQFFTNQGSGSFTGKIEITGRTNPANAGTVTGTGSYSIGDTAVLEAVTNDLHFTFEAWDDGETANPRTITVGLGRIRYTAVFNKNKIEVGGTYFLYGKKRWALPSIPVYIPMDAPPTFYTEVLSADINEDLLQKSTSTIVCKDEVTLEEGDLIFIRDDKANVVYNGFIKEVNGKTIVTDQIQSFFNFDLYAMADSTYDKAQNPNYTALSMTLRYLNDIKSGHSSTRVDSGGSWIDPADSLQQSMGQGVNLDYIATSSLSKYPYRKKNEVINGESLLYQMYSQYELIPYLWINYAGHTDAFDWSKIYIFLADDIQDGNEYIPPYKTIDLGDNAEFIKDINVATTIEDSNLIFIYDSAGTTYRGGYVIQTDGTYGTINVFSPSNRYTPPRKKYINSDDDLTEIRDAELKRIQHNHKVTFTFDLNNSFYDFADFGLGQGINFYVGDRLYNSVLTGWSFHIENGKKLDSVRMVCGKVRNDLTSKLNLGKVK